MMTEESDSLRTDYSDNYITLLPGEMKAISVDVENKEPATTPRKLHFELSGINCPKQTLEMEVQRD